MITLSDYTISVDLPNPILGDSEQMDIGTQFQFSMSKVIHSTVKKNVRSRLLLNFVDVKQSVYDLFKAWYPSVAGKMIVYVDYDGNSWDGIIMNNPLETVAVGRKEYFDVIWYKEVYNFTIELQVVTI